ncbi:A/G-specific adenine glycosylase [Croceivirga lutea]|uniref:A/G-specific adenine glycosylase n=1 Tax=Croceivirga lutea TaxID=1775167 RepID=UPI00163B2AF8|nr:A/G-specific adenine glycosylase [Croceivirga lutea]GGG37091.1 A/G-specific adenine glycosylase [Croceivirga lutea]
MQFSQIILDWYSENKRELPWRSTVNPYKIWLSEIMLQQTRVAQGLPYYERFVEEFPTVFDLASASEEKILKLWQGLGYYSRARNMHFTAKQVVNEYGGKFPNTYKELLKLKGIGDYTASAIASICFGELVPVVDGNVYRVLARYFGVETPINSTDGIKYFKNLAEQVMSAKDIRDYNQGIMEFGAIQCSPKKPLCLYCPLKDSCKAISENRVLDLPKKLKKTKIRNRYFNYLVFIDGKNTILEQRKGKGIWQNLFQFPLYETASVASHEMLEKHLQKINKDYQKVTLYNHKPIIHKLSHQHLYTNFWIIETKRIEGEYVNVEDLKNYPVPVLIAEFIETFNF